MNLITILTSLLLLSSTTAFVPPSFGRVTSRIHRNQQLNVLGDDHFDMEELKQRISQETSPQLFAVKKEPAVRPEQVHVILFNPHTEEEGMHTIEYPKGSGTNVILAFEDSNDCNVFSEHLKAQQFPDPSVSTLWNVVVCSDACTTQS